MWSDRGYRCGGQGYEKGGGGGSFFMFRNGWMDGWMEYTGTVNNGTYGIGI